MLSRRYLRIKVFQSLYAYWQSDNASAARIEKELFVSIDRYAELVEQATEEKPDADRIAALDAYGMAATVEHPPEAKQALLELRAESDRLRMECEKRRISWVGQMDLFVKLYKEIEASGEYAAYMADPEPGFAKDQAFLVRLFSGSIANSEALQEEYEARSIYWMEDLDLAATLVKRSLEQMRDTDTGDLDMGELLRDPREETQFVTTLFRKTVELGDEHEKAIADKASNWEADRIALSDMILMKMALTEVRVFDQIPVKVTLNEYIEIAKALGASVPQVKTWLHRARRRLAKMLKDRDLTDVTTEVSES